MADKDPVQLTERTANRLIRNSAEWEKHVKGHPPRSRRPMPGDDQGEIEFGKPTVAFETGTTITLNPVDVDGEDNELDDVVVWLAADRANATLAPAKTNNDTNSICFMISPFLQ